MHILWALALAAVVLALLVGNSQEFHDFAPLAVEDAVFYPIIAVIGFLAAVTTVGSNTIFRLVLFFVVLFLPAIIYGTAMVLFWVEIGGTTLLDFFILQASRRVLVYMGAMAFIGGFGLIIGYFIGETYLY